MNSSKTVMIVVAAFVALGGGAWALWGRSSEAGEQVDLPENLTKEGIAARMNEPEKMMDTWREARSEELTEEQRRAARQNMRNAWREAMKQRVDEYFNASDEDRTAVLDGQIDEWQGMMDRWQSARAEREKERKKNGEKDAERPERPNGFASRTQEERKAQSEARDPDESARQMAYFTAVMKRAQERGIQMPGRFGGRGGANRGGANRGGANRGGGRRGP